MKKDEKILIGIKLEEMQENEVIKEFLSRNLFDSQEKNKKYYVLNAQNLEELGLNQIKLEDENLYIVEYTEAKVYYTAGFKDSEGKICYTVLEVEEKSTN